MEEKMVEEKEEFKIVDVATEFGKAIQTPSGEIVSDSQLLVWIANQLFDMRKKLG